MRTVKFLDLTKLHYSLQPELNDVIDDIITNSSFIGGDDVTFFEQEFAKYVGARHCIGVANGTDALEIIIRAIGITGAGIIVPVNTAVPTVEAVVNSGNTPVFCDCGPNYTITADDINEMLSPNVAAVIPVHLYGDPCNDNVFTFAEDHGLTVIEDCCQAHGAYQYADTHVGNFGKAGAFSFYPSKNLGAMGDAGAIVTNYGAIAEKCRMLANHGRLHKFDHEICGRNSRLDALQAAILSMKLPHLDRWVTHRRSMAELYDELLNDVTDVYTPFASPGHAYHLYVIYADRRDALRTYLAQHGIETGLHYPFILSNLPAYKEYRVPKVMFASELPSHVLSLPMGPHLTPEDVRYTCDTIKRFYGQVA